MQILGDQLARFAEIEAVLGALREHAAKNDQELRRYQDGYSFSMNKALIRGILRVLDSVNEEIGRMRAAGQNPDAGPLGLVAEHLEVLLSNEAVVAIEPVIGDDYSNWRSVAKAVPRPTNDPAESNKIIEVLRQGFVLDLGVDPNPLVRPAELAVYKYTGVVDQEAAV